MLDAVACFHEREGHCLGQIMLSRREDIVTAHTVVRSPNTTPIYAPNACLWDLVHEHSLWHSPYIFHLFFVSKILSDVVSQVNLQLVWLNAW